MAYSDKVIDHYENPRNVGALDKGAEDVGTGLVGAPPPEASEMSAHAAGLERDEWRTRLR